MIARLSSANLQVRYWLWSYDLPIVDSYFMLSCDESNAFDFASEMEFESVGFDAGYGSGGSRSGGGGGGGRLVRLDGPAAAAAAAGGDQQLWRGRAAQLAGS